MSDPPKPKRLHPKSGRPASSDRATPSAQPAAVDPEATHQGRRHVLTEVRTRRSASRPKVDAMPARIGALEAELARLTEARGADADELARMLVRIAEAELEKAALEERATALAARLRELETTTSRATDLENVCAALERDLALARERAQGDSEALALAQERGRRDSEALELAQERTRRDAEALELAHERARQDGEALEIAHERARRDADALERMQERARKDAEALDIAQERARRTTEALEIAQDLARKDLEALETAQELARRNSEALEIAQEVSRRDTEAVEAAKRRAELAETAAEDGARALHAAYAERDADRGRLTDLEAKLARTRREHGEEIASLRVTHAAEADALRAALAEETNTLRTAHAQEMGALRTARAEADLQAAHALEGERSAHARVRQQLAAMEAELRTVREAVGRANELFDEMGRREEIAAAIRIRSMEQVRGALACGGLPAKAADSQETVVARPPSQAPRRRSGDEPSVEVMSLEDIEVDLAD